MKLTNDFCKVLTKLRDCSDNDKMELEIKNALSEIERIRGRYNSIADRKRIVGHERISQEYSDTIKRINELTEFARSLAFLLSEPHSNQWVVASDALDASINDIDD